MRARSGTTSTDWEVFGNGEGHFLCGRCWCLKRILRVNFFCHVSSIIHRCLKCQASWPTFALISEASSFARDGKGLNILFEGYTQRLRVPPDCLLRLCARSRTRTHTDGVLVGSRSQVCGCGQHKRDKEAAAPQRRPEKPTAVSNYHFRGHGWTIGISPSRLSFVLDLGKCFAFGKRWQAANWWRPDSLAPENHAVGTCDTKMLSLDVCLIVFAIHHSVKH